MVVKNNFCVNADLDSLWFMFGSALRYALGRQTYATDLISQVIIDNLGLINQKWTDNLLRDLEEYESDRKLGLRVDDDCDYSSWIKLKSALLNQQEIHNVESYI